MICNGTSKSSRAGAEYLCLFGLTRSKAKLATIWVGLCTASAAAAQTGYTITDLGTCPLNVAGINKSGQIAANDEGGSYRWSPATGKAYLGGFGPAYNSDAFAINAAGQVVGRGTKDCTLTFFDGIENNLVTKPETRAFLWDGTLADLGSVADPFYLVFFQNSSFYQNTTTQANAVNDHGQALCMTYNGPTGTNGCFVSSGGSVYDLFERDAYPTSINSGGCVVLGAPYFIRALDTNADGIADVWYRDLDSDGVNDLRVPVAYLPGGWYAGPLAINDANRIVGAASTGEVDAFDNEIDHAVLWDNDGATILDLGTLPGDDGSFADCINNSGQVLGESFVSASSSWSPFVWDSTHGMRSINAMLPAGSGWTCTQGMAINDNGEVVCLANQAGGADHLVLLKPISTATPIGATVTVTPSPTLPLTVSFDSVTGGGTTTVTTTTSAPALPSGFQVSGTFIDIATTASFSGFITVCVPYDPAIFPFYPDGLTENDRWPNGQPRLLHYDAALGRWQNVTSGVNADSHLVSGVTASLSPFAVVRAVPVSYGIVALYDQGAARRSGSTVPIKIRLTDASGNVSSESIVVTATGVVRVSTNAPGALADAGAANPDNNFRYDASLGGYIFNLSLSGYSTGTYRLSFTAGADSATHTVDFQVK